MYSQSKRALLKGFEIVCCLSPSDRFPELNVSEVLVSVSLVSEFNALALANEAALSR